MVSEISETSVSETFDQKHLLILSQKLNSNCFRKFRSIQFRHTLKLFQKFPKHLLRHTLNSNCFRNFRSICFQPYIKTVSEISEALASPYMKFKLFQKFPKHLLRLKKLFQKFPEHFAIHQLKLFQKFSKHLNHSGGFFDLKFLSLSPILNYQRKFQDVKNSPLPKNVSQVIISAEVTQLKSYCIFYFLPTLCDPSENNKRRHFFVRK